MQVKSKENFVICVCVLTFTLQVLRRVGGEESDVG